MKVKLDDKHVFNSDGLSCWISTLVESKKGTAYERRVTGYCRSFLDAIDKYIGMRLKTSTNSDIRLLRAEVQEIRATVYGWENKYVECQRKK